MSVAEAVAARRSVRDLSARPVPAQLFHRVATLAMETTSSWNRQSRSMVIVTDPTVREAAISRGARTPDYSHGSATAAVRLEQDLKDRGLLREYAVKDAMIVASFAMLATDGSLLAALDVLAEASTPSSRVIAVNVLSNPQSLERVLDEHPDLTIVTSSVERDLDENAFMGPGIGDFGDRHLRTDVAKP